MRTKIFYDAEFTGLHQSTQLISLALCDQQGRAFYAEFTDFDQALCDVWIKQHVLSLTRWVTKADVLPFTDWDDDLQLCYGDTNAVKTALVDWLSVYDALEIWADCLAWDWVLFCELFGGALHLPKQIFYMPFDLVTLFDCKGFDADISRLAFAQARGITIDDDKTHNALFDARLTLACHELLTRADNRLVVS